jgi:ribosomal protein S18 acetylase RimI-like enzyme
LAQPFDQADLERIAEGAFRFGRYHSDPYFPSELADRRYREWVRSALSGSSPDNVMYVIRRAGRAAGLSHVEFEGTRGHLTIIAVERSAQSQDIGQELGNMMRSDFHRRGLKEVWSQVSAINSQVLNFALPRGYRALKPQVIYHWHAPQAPHLVPWEKIYA